MKNETKNGTTESAAPRRRSLLERLLDALAWPWQGMDDEAKWATVMSWRHLM